MTVLNKIDSAIQRIGERLVVCRLACEGTQCEPNNGIIPRCLVLERDGRAEGPGVAVVGLNPGMSSEREQRFYRTKGIGYQSVLEFWVHSPNPGKSVALKNVPYYQRLRELMDDLGFNGPILWTDLVKCESLRGERPALQTFRTCVDRFLYRELEEIPDWSLVGVGRESFTALAYRFPDKAVLGVPHPTGSYGYFARLRNVPLPVLREKVTTLFRNGEGQAVWLMDAIRSKGASDGK